MPIIESHLDEFLRNKLKKEMPIVGAFIGEKTITSLKKIFVAELEQLFPQIIGGFVSNLVTDLDLEQLIVRKLGEVPIRNVELAFRKNFATQLKIAMGIGALIGLLIGILTMLIIYLASG